VELLQVFLDLAWVLREIMVVVSHDLADRALCNENGVTYKHMKLELRYTAHFTHFFPSQRGKFIMLRTIRKQITKYQDMEDFHPEIQKYSASLKKSKAIPVTGCRASHIFYTVD
jgi:hypothetical protein